MEAASHLVIYQQTIATSYAKAAGQPSNSAAISDDFKLKTERIGTCTQSLVRYQWAEMHIMDPARQQRDKVDPWAIKKAATDGRLNVFYGIKQNAYLAASGFL